MWFKDLFPFIVLSKNFILLHFNNELLKHTRTIYSNHGYFFRLRAILLVSKNFLNFLKSLLIDQFIKVSSVYRVTFFKFLYMLGN